LHRITIMIATRYALKLVGRFAFWRWPGAGLGGDADQVVTPKAGGSERSALIDRDGRSDNRTGSVDRPEGAAQRRVIVAC
jgi:hypothetical protein